MGSENTVERIGGTSFSTPSDREVVMTCVVEAPRGVVFEAWTSPRHVPQWMLGPAGWTMPVCEVDLRPGGAWRFVWRREDGTEMAMRGTYKEVSPPGRVVSTESWGEPWPETINTLVLTEQGGQGGRTTVTQTVLYPTKEARDAALRTGMKEGVAQSFERLARYVKPMAGAAGAQSKENTTMSTKIFVNLPVKDLEKSKRFYGALGYANNPQFTDETAACMVISGDIYVMLLTRAKFKAFLPREKEVGDATASTEVLLALSCQSRGHVDELVGKAVAAGGSTYAGAKDYGFMYQHGFQDPDGHIWELIHMEPGAAQG